MRTPNSPPVIESEEGRHPCVHSRHDPDCIGCWEGEALRCGALLKEARDLLREARGYLLNNDPYTAPMVLRERINEAVEGYP